MINIFVSVSVRQLKLDYILVENIRALLIARNIDQGDMAFAVGHSQAWISKILSGDRKMSLSDVDRVAAFFGLTGAQLLSHGISSMTERRQQDRRSGVDRRKGDRRKEDIGAMVHRSPFLQRERPREDDEGAA
jgi:transcriptional regulator with XRE-family HTH domain